MTAQPTRNNFNSSEDTRMHRLWNPSTKCYLHLSGTGETPDVNMSWLGYAHQADTLRDRALARGEPWPYRRRSRYADQVTVPSFDDAEV